MLFVKLQFRLTEKACNTFRFYQISLKFQENLKDILKQEHAKETIVEA